MTHPISSTKSDDVSTALALATDALATARQFAMPGAAEAAGALILGAFEGGVSTDIDIDLRVPIAYARGAAAWLVTEGVGVPWSPELHRRCDRLADALDTVCAAFRPARPATAHLMPPSSRQHKPRIRPSDGLRTKAEAAAKLGCSTKTVDGYVSTGVLHYVALGHGKKRRRKMFADADLDEFIANQTRKDVPCPSTRTRTVARRISTSTSKCEVFAFTALQKRRTSAKPKK
jgi:hypothetical protein